MFPLSTAVQNEILPRFSRFLWKMILNEVSAKNQKFIDRVKIFKASSLFLCKMVLHCAENKQILLSINVLTLVFINGRSSGLTCRLKNGKLNVYGWVTWPDKRLIAVFTFLEESFYWYPNQWKCIFLKQIKVLWSNSATFCRMLVFVFFGTTSLQPCIPPDHHPKVSASLRNTSEHAQRWVVTNYNNFLKKIE